jgi:hypothetical protein
MLRTIRIQGAEGSIVREKFLKIIKNEKYSRNLMNSVGIFIE